MPGAALRSSHRGNLRHDYYRRVVRRTLAGRSKMECVAPHFLGKRLASREGGLLSLGADSLLVQAGCGIAGQLGAWTPEPAIPPWRQR